MSALFVPPSSWMWIVWAPSTQKYGMGAVKLFFTVKPSQYYFILASQRRLERIPNNAWLILQQQRGLLMPRGPELQTSSTFISQVRQSIYVLGIITTKWIQSICSSEFHDFKGRLKFFTRFLVMKHQVNRCITFFMSHYTTNYYIHNIILKFDWLRNIASLFFRQAVSLCISVG